MTDKQRAYIAFVRWARDNNYPALAAKLRTDRPGQMVGAPFTFTIKRKGNHHEK